MTLSSSKRTQPRFSMVRLTATNLTVSVMNQFSLFKHSKHLVLLLLDICLNKAFKNYYFYFCFQNYKLLASVLCAALYPNIVQILSPELKYKQTSTGAMCKAPTVEDLKVIGELIGIRDYAFDFNNHDTYSKLKHKSVEHFVSAL